MGEVAVSKPCSAVIANNSQLRVRLRRQSMNFMAGQPRSKDINSAEEILEEAKAGRAFILIDGDGPDNVGAVCIPAQYATRQVVNFMARYARGLICLALTPQRVRELKLSAMALSDETSPEPSCALSIKARRGGASDSPSADRAWTIAVAIDPESRPEDLASPGHIFPLIAQEGGILAKAGQAEVAVDVARLAGLNPSGVICEVMDETGPIGGLTALLKFARRHRMKLGTIADLVAYRLRYERG